MSKHYWLATVNIYFTLEDVLQDTSINVLIKNNEGYIPRTLLASTQVQAQAQLAKALGGEMPTVHSVITANISYLGFMTEQEFLDEPR